MAKRKTQLPTVKPKAVESIENIWQDMDDLHFC